MKITYKDVGQGDSITLEWENGGVQKIGIIDCNRKGRLNPVIDHLEATGHKEIDFIILSHPHRDHYSGMLDLLVYLEKKGYQVKRFCHTLHWSATNYWKYFEVGSADSRLLKKIISKLGTLKEAGLIKRIDGLGCDSVLKIDSDLTLECLAPSHDDAVEFQKIVNADADKNVKEASQAANHLSTIFKICVGEVGILFTSDAEITALEGIIDRDNTSLTSTSFQLCQLPHHGSVNNHYPAFWNILVTGHLKHAVISAGMHRTYNHPSYEVISAFHEEGYSIHCTNILNGMKQFTEHLASLIEVSTELDSVSEIAEEYRISGDRVFLLTEHGFKLQ